MSAEGFSRTLETARSADGVAALLTRASEKIGGPVYYGDRARLIELAAKYRDYAEALRQTVPTEEAGPVPDQAAML